MSLDRFYKKWVFEDGQGLNITESVTLDYCCATAFAIEADVQYMKKRKKKKGKATEEWRLCVPLLDVARPMRLSTRAWRSLRRS